MSMLSSVTTGVIKEPLFVIVYGMDGVGKSSLAADGPSAIFIGPEAGTKKLNVSRFPPIQDYAVLMKALKELYTDPHPYKLLAFDTIDWFEPMVHKETMRRAGVTSFEKGDLAYGRGPIKAVEVWNDIRIALEALREKRGMHIFILGHAVNEKFTDPSNNHLTYDRWVLKLDKKAAAFWREAVDAVLFANFITYATESDSGKVTTSSSTTRALFTERRAGFDAKNRYGLPPKINLNWDDLTAAIDRGFPESEPEIMERITGYLAALTDDAKRDLISVDVEQAKGNIKRLTVYASRLAEIISKQGATA